MFGVLIIAALASVALVPIAWRRGGADRGFATLGLVIATLVFGAVAFFYGLAEALCEYECDGTAMPEVFTTLTIVSLAFAVVLAFVSPRRS